MKRLTVADEIHSDGRMVFHQVGYITSDMAHDLYWALKKYEDTGYGPEVFQRLNRPETPYEIAADEEIRRLRAQIVSLSERLEVVTREREEEAISKMFKMLQKNYSFENLHRPEKLPENPQLTSEQIMALDDLDAVWMYSWRRSTPVTVESGRCAKMMLECPPRQQTLYGSDWWFFAHKPTPADIEGVWNHSDC